MKKRLPLLLVLILMSGLLCSCGNDRPRNIVNTNKVPVNEAGKMLNRVRAQTGNDAALQGTSFTQRTKSGVVLYRDNTTSNHTENIFAD